MLKIFVSCWNLQTWAATSKLKIFYSNKVFFSFTQRRFNISKLRLRTITCFCFNTFFFFVYQWNSLTLSPPLWPFFQKRRGGITLTFFFRIFLNYFRSKSVKSTSKFYFTIITSEKLHFCKIFFFKIYFFYVFWKFFFLFQKL